jgi:enoyl-CoA hydratase/carnithine racemase
MESLSDIVTERSGRIIDVAFNRPTKKNALTLSMYSTLADLLNDAAKDDGIRVVLLHGTGDSFTAGNDIGDFLKHPPAPGDSPQERLIDALVDFDKPLVAAVHGAAVGSGTTMLPHFDFVYAGESAVFQMPFVNLALVPEFGASYTIPAQLGYLAAAELILMAQPFDARRARELGFVTRVVSDEALLTTARETAERLAEKPAGALRASKRLLKRSLREDLEGAARAEIQEFTSRVRSTEAKQAFAAFLAKHRPETR